MAASRKGNSGSVIFLGGNAAASAAAAAQSASDAAASAAIAAGIASGLTYKGVIDGANVAALSPSTGDLYFVDPAGGGYSLGDWIAYNGSTWDVLPEDAFYNVGLFESKFAARAPRKGIDSDGTSFAGYTADNASLAFGTNDLSFFAWIGPDDYTPASNRPIVTKFTGSLGLKVWLLTTSFVRVEIGNGSNFSTYRFDTTAVLSATDGDINLLTGTLDADGNMVVKLNGIAVGDPVAISAASAQTRTSAGALYWLSDASTHHAATLSECGLVNGLLTDAQITAMVRNGTAQGLGLTMYQHLVPDQSLAAGIFEDISGNANHAVLGASGIELIVIDELPADAPAQALRSDGSNTSRIYSMLNGQGLGAGDGVGVWSGIFPQDAPSAARRLFSLTSSISTVFQPGSLHLSYTTTTGLRLTIVGVTTSDYRNFASVALYARLVALGARGVPCTIIAGRASGEPVIYLGVGGRVYNVTNLFTDTPEGASAPDWDYTLNDLYQVAFYSTSTESSAQTMHGLDVLNAAPTKADIEYRVRNGRWATKYAAGSQTLRNGSTAVNGSAPYSVFTGASATGVTLEGAAATVSRCSFYLGADRWVVGQRYRINFDWVRTSGASSMALQRRLSADGAIQETITSDVGNTGAKSYTFVWDGAGEYLILNCGSGTGFVGSISNLKVFPEGVTAALDLQDGGGFQPKNPRFENGSSHWEMSTSGVDWAVKKLSGGRIAITKTYTHDQISSTAATTIFGYKPIGYVVREIQRNVTTAFDATLVFDLGIFGTAEKYGSDVDLVSTGYALEDSANKLPTATVETLYIQKSGATTQGEVTVTVILERVF